MTEHKRRPISIDHHGSSLIINPAKRHKRNQITLSTKVHSSTHCFFFFNVDLVSVKLIQILETRKWFLSIDTGDSQIELA